jgi:NAD(P)-dependent dehydrogenase (short-subunit alcohol dehydrogenase family)
VITGGGTGMGRELALQLAAEGCNIALCDVIGENMEQTAERIRKEGAQGVRVATFKADVAVEQEMHAFAAAVQRDLQTDHIHLLFNNAGVGGGGGFVSGSRAEWDKTFAVCWGGVYHGTRAFLPLLLKATEGYIVNTSSVNGFWASVGQGRPHTAYCSAKFAVKGFTEALMTDLAVNAPHIKAAVVMPGHIGTEIAANSRKILGQDGGFVAEAVKKQIVAQGGDPSKLTPEQLDAILEKSAESFRDRAPTTAAKAATIILDGVRNDRWRILVGQDAEYLDSAVRRDPENAYGPGFYEDLKRNTSWQI